MLGAASGAALCLRRQEVAVVLVVDLEHADLHGVGPTVLLELLDRVKDLLHGPGDDSKVVLVPKHLQFKKNVVNTG